MKFTTIMDENNFRKRKRALKRYFGKAYRYLIFKVLPTLKEKNKKDGSYSIVLPTTKLFEKVYGNIVFHFRVENDVAIYEEIFPCEFLNTCYEKDLPVYKGIPYGSKKDLTKIKIMEKLI